MIDLIQQQDYCLDQNVLCDLRLPDNTFRLVVLMFQKRHLLLSAGSIGLIMIAGLYTIGQHSSNPAEPRLVSVISAMNNYALSRDSE